VVEIQATKNTILFFVTPFLKNVGVSLANEKEEK